MIASPQNRYEVIGTIGTGATSRVDKARDSMIGRTVALKTFLHSFGSGDLQKQFLREAQIIGRLSHPFIVGIYDVGVNPDGRPYLVLEYVEGKTLDATLDAGRLPLERAALWAADLASALSRAHQCKVIHGDVKPANVLITPEGQVKLGDFGIARFATQVSGSGRILGTPAYLSPEQILGHKQDSRSDLFSLGIMLYQMTTGVRPFDGSSVGAVCAQIVSTEPLPPSHHNPELPAEFDHVVMRCLAKNPSNRYATAEALGASLYPFVSSKPIAAAPLARSWWKHPMQAGDLRLAAGVLVGLAIFGSGARAVWHHGLHKSNNDVSRLHAPQGSANGVGTDPSAPSMSGSRPINSEPSAYVINIGNADLSSPYVSAEQHSASGNGEESEDARNNSLATGAYPDLAGPTSVDTFSSTPMVSNPFARHTVPTAKPKALHLADSADDAAMSSSHSSAKTGTVAALSNAPAPAAAAKPSLHIDVVSTVTDETLSIFSGDELLLTTPLQAGHVGDTLRFDCPVAPGQHAFRVVLTRPDESVLVEKANTSQIRADASNFLGIHVLRHNKLFVKHETSLEVVWPSAPAPVVVAGGAPHAVGALTLR